MDIENVNILLHQVVSKNELIQAVISSPREKHSPQKVMIKPLLLKKKEVYQLSYQYAQKILHENKSSKEFLSVFLNLLKSYKQILICCVNADFHILISKKGELKILKKPPSKKALSVPLHNRQKNYLLKEGTVIPFLVELGVMSPLGKIFHDKRDKFRQINRFVEMIHDVLCYFPKDQPLRIVDFGCGKAYLTFALYHYLHNELHYALEIIGLDLKEDVVLNCQAIAKKLQFNHLFFMQGDINTYSNHQPVDLMVCLHACDTATDAAIEKAVCWNTRVIMAVPCCQHELFKQINCKNLDSLLNHGILRERFTALVTDAARANLLEILGYKAQILEFIDLEHTPKNLLIRAVKHPSVQENKEVILQRYKLFKETLNIFPNLEKRFSSFI